MISGLPSSALTSTATQALGGDPPSAPAKNPLDNSDKRIKEFEKKEGDLSAKLDTICTETAAKNDKLETYFAQNKPPEYKPPAPYKAPQDDNPISAWGALAIGLRGARLALHPDADDDGAERHVGGHDVAEAAEGRRGEGRL